MNFINLNCPPLPYFIVGGGCVYRPGDIHERRTIRNVFDLIYVHSGTLYLEQDPFRVELNAGQFFIITPDTPHRGSRVCQEKTTTSWVHFYTNGKYSLSDEFYPDNVTRRAAPKFYYSPQNFILSLPRTGTVPEANREKLEKYLDCYRGLDSLEEPMMKRIFSKRYLKDSKSFEREMERNVVTAARRYCPEITADMDIQTVLEQLLIEENSQELAVKGPLKLKIWKGSEAKRVDLSDFTYGVVLNSQTVKHAMVEVEQPALKKIVTIENKTNYLAMEYDPEILYIYSHGYFSPLEREFLKKLQRVIEGKDVEVFHSGDMDYGGIRIFEYIQKHIFPGIKPLQMDVETYEKYEEYAKTISKETMEKLEKVNVPLLEELKEKLLETGKGIEQESFLIEE